VPNFDLWHRKTSQSGTDFGGFPYSSEALISKEFAFFLDANFLFGPSFDFPKYDGFHCFVGTKP
jgi:hypothetical protein